MSKIVIIGGGAAGLVAAIKASLNNEVTILERNNTCGKKLLITGNGHCNYWNANQDLSNYHSHTPSLIENFITKTNLEKTKEFLLNLGIIPKIKNGYYYPLSNQAITIKNALIYEAKRNNVQIKENFFVTAILKENNHFIITSKNEKIFADKIIVATGSKAAPKTGSTGSGYQLLENLGHKIIPVLPSLVHLQTNNKILASCEGVRCDVNLSLYENDVLLAQESGELQLTKKNISGICTFNLSYYVAKGLYLNKKETLKINFLPFLQDLSFEEILNWFTKRNQMMHNPELSYFLEPLLNYKIVNFFLKEQNLKPTSTWNDLQKDQKSNLIKNLLNYPVEIISTNSFTEAQTCSGGIPLSEININTMESKIQKNLYIIGELLDITGNCGGYNLTVAFISGYLAGSSV